MLGFLFCMGIQASAQKEAKDALLKALDRQYEHVKKKKRLGSETRSAQFEYIEGVRRAFKADDPLPDPSVAGKEIKTAIKDYVEKMTKAQDKCWKECEKAASAYRRQGNVARATAIQEEGRAFRQRTSALLAQPINEGVLLSTAEVGPPWSWLYTTVKPGPGWTAPQFDTRDWATGIAAFGSEGTSNIRIGTLWNTEAIWLRTSVDVPRLSPDHVIILRLRHDEDVKIYVNGELLIQLPWWNNNYDEIVLTDAQKSLFCEGRNTLAVNCTNKGGAQGIDLGLTLFLKK